MVSNYLSFVFSFLEIFIYGGAVYGFGFLQYIFEKEEVFWDELCFGMGTVFLTTDGNTERFGRSVPRPAPGHSGGMENFYLFRYKNLDNKLRSTQRRPNGSS